MKQNWKYVLPIAATSLSFFTSVVSADATDSAQMRNLENRVSALEQRKGAGGMINPQGRPQVKDGFDVFVFGNLLYWNAHENGINTAIKEYGVNRAAYDSNIVLDDAKVIDLSGHWNWGFRAGLGYNTPHDGWDLKATYLRFSDNSYHKHNHGNGKDGFFPTLIMPSLETATDVEDGYATKVHSYWGFNLNQGDLELGREFFVSKWLTVRPHAGLRTDWIHQNLHAAYYDLTTAGAVATHDAYVGMKDHWWGLGLAGGMDTQWGMGSGWSIFANAATAIVYGFHQLDYDLVTENFVAPHSAKDYADVHNSYRMAHPILDLQMGLRWDHMFSKDRFHVGFDLGWEHHVFFSQNQFPAFTGDTNVGTFVANQGDLTMQGWTFAARFDF